MRIELNVQHDRNNYVQSKASFSTVDRRHLKHFYTITIFAAELVTTGKKNVVGMSSLPKLFAE